MARYLLQEPFYDNLVLWEANEEVEWDGPPAPSMIPLDDDAREKMAAYMKERGITDYTPPLSEIADTMDGQRTVANFHPGDRKNRPAKVTPPFPPTPGKPGAQYTKQSSKEKATAAEAPLNVPKKEGKNFDRAPR